MPRRFGRFEVKREMSDGGKIRPDDVNTNKNSQMDPELLEELEKVGFDDMDSEIEGTVEENILDKLNDQEKRIIMDGYRGSATQSELSANVYLGREAKKLGIDKQELKQFILKMEKDTIKSPDKVLHYHRTSIENAEKIINSGYLLSRENIKSIGGDISKFAGSSSSNVQFSVDRYDEMGNLLSAGFDSQDNLGANSMDVVFVMSPQLLQEETYDCFGMYPTVEKADIQKFCATILAQNPEIQTKLVKMLRDKGIEIPVILQKEFDRENILDNLKSRKQVNIQNELEGQPETDVTEVIAQDNEITKPITNEDVKKELAEFYTDDITNDYLEAYLSEKIYQIYGEKLSEAGIFNVRKFLDGKLDHFKGVESYQEIIEDLESTLEISDSVKDIETAPNDGKEEYQPKGSNIEPSKDENSSSDRTEETGINLKSINGKSIEELTATYERVGIKQEDLNTAYAMLSRTKDEREKINLSKPMQPKIDEFEGR